jgi:methionine synthase I (cobalamin-dependent)
LAALFTMTFHEALTADHPLLMDGAMGTELIHRGFTSATWRANLDAPELVRAIHAEFADAGAEVLLTNTFVMNRLALGDESLMEVGQAAVRLARSVAGPRWLLGSMGPETITEANFADPGAVLATVAALSGVDGILLETCSDLSAFAAAQWIRGRYPELPVLVSFTFAPNEDAKAREWARAAQANDIAALGVNCGCEQAPADIGRVLGIFRRETSKPLFARPNAGTPKRDGTRWVYPLSPEEWANETIKLCEPGLAIIGGCCGATPEHIAALSERLRCGPIFQAGRNNEAINELK